MTHVAATPRHVLPEVNLGHTEDAHVLADDVVRVDDDGAEVAHRVEIEDDFDRWRVLGLVFPAHPLVPVSPTQDPCQSYLIITHHG